MNRNVLKNWTERRKTDAGAESLILWAWQSITMMDSFDARWPSQIALWKVCGLINSIWKLWKRNYMADPDCRAALGIRDYYFQDFYVECGLIYFCAGILYSNYRQVTCWHGISERQQFMTSVLQFFPSFSNYN